jgi:hypothetical protein
MNISLQVWAGVATCNCPDTPTTNLATEKIPTAGEVFLETLVAPRTGLTAVHAKDYR